MIEKYLNHEITLNSDNEFTVSGPLLEGVWKSFDTFAKAKAYISDISRADSKKDIEHVKLPVMSPYGESLLVKGIHTGTSELLYVKPPKKSFDRHVYPDDPFVAQLLKKRDQTAQLLNDIELDLETISIDSRYGYGRMKVSDLQEGIENLKEQHARALKVLDALKDGGPRKPR